MVLRSIPAFHETEADEDGCQSDRQAGTARIGSIWRGSGFTCVYQPVVVGVGLAGGQEEDASGPVEASDAGDLAGVVDYGGCFKDPAGGRGNQAIEVPHAITDVVNKGMLAGGDLRPAHDSAAVVDAVGPAA